MSNSLQNNNAPLWLRDVGYFRNAYLGDLIVLKNALYYIPHTNKEGYKNEIRNSVSIVTRHLGLIGLVLNLAIVAAISLARKGNPSVLKTAGIMGESNTADELQRKLDEVIAEGRKQSIDIGEHGLIKPLKFVQTDIKNVKVGLNKLRFDSAFDNHDFKTDFLKKKSLENALWMNGFLKVRQ